MMAGVLKSVQTRLVGLEVKGRFEVLNGVIAKYDPTTGSMCDVLVQRDDGLQCWYAASQLCDVTYGAALPNRRDVLAAIDAETKRTLEAIRAQWSRQWQGMPPRGHELMLEAIDEAIARVSKKP
jgi:hypothetical protein